MVQAVPPIMLPWTKPFTHKSLCSGARCGAGAQCPAQACGSMWLWRPRRPGPAFGHLTPQGAECLPGVVYYISLWGSQLLTGLLDAGVPFGPLI